MISALCDSHRTLLTYFFPLYVQHAVCSCGSTCHHDPTFSPSHSSTHHRKWQVGTAHVVSTLHNQIVGRLTLWWEPEAVCMQSCQFRKSREMDTDSSKLCSLKIKQKAWSFKCGLFAKLFRMCATKSCKCCRCRLIKYWLNKHPELSWNKNWAFMQ